MPKIQKIKAKDFEKALYDMVFAYFNKDDDFPHSFEIEALKEAEKLISNYDKKKNVRIIYNETVNKLHGENEE